MTNVALKRSARSVCGAAPQQLGSSERSAKQAKRGLPLAWLAVLGLAGLGGPAEAVVTANGDMSPIASLPAPDLSGVGHLGNGCSAVLLKGGTHLLGAAHCHEGPGGTVSFASGVQATIAQVVLAPGWEGKPGVNDLAVMTLAAPVQGVSGYVLAPARAVALPCVVLLAGWGAGGTGLTGADGNAVPAKALRYGYNEYDALLPPIETYGNRVAMFDFDDGSKPHNTLGRTGLAEYEAMLAPLDSGGPSFVAVAGRWQIAGIHVGIITHKGTGFGGVGLDLRVAPYARWIASQIGPAP